LLVCGLAALGYLKKQAGLKTEGLAGFVAGHSLGEYTAVAAAGGMDFETAVKLVRLRGQAMVDSGVVGGMSAILGLEPEVADKVAKDAGVVFANDNSAGQAIFSGAFDKLEVAEEAAKAAGAKRALRLNVAGPFHTPEMRPAADKVGEYLAANPLKGLVVPCVMNASAEARSKADEVADGLVAQVVSRVRWRESMIRLADQDVTQVVELGVGKVLSGLAGRCDARLAAVSLSSRAEVDAWLEAQVQA
jgi:[acyl-carrier-protein] S-malonyltransferase